MMTRHTRLHGLFIITVLLAGCLGTPPTKTAALRPILASPAGVTPGTPIISDNGSGIAAAPIVAHGETDPGGHNGASLSGCVLAPVAIIANHGGGYRLQAIEQVPVTVARVTLTDAAGKPLATADLAGDGSYAFKDSLPPGNLLLEVALKDGRGKLRAIAPAGTRQVDVELVSTLTTAYILEKYVRPQANPQQALDKLPATVERDTRLKAEAAFVRATSPLAELTDGRVVQAVEDLRSRDPELDAQLETVKRLLVAAGVSDLGNGKPATEVALQLIGDVVRMDDGTVYLSSTLDSRIWRLAEDGKLYTAVGSTPGRIDKAIDGLRGEDAALGSIAALAATPAGELLVLEGNRLTRLDEDGILHQLANGFDQGLGLTVEPDGTIHYLAIQAKLISLWRLPPGKPAEKLHTFDGLQLVSTRRMVNAGPLTARLGIHGKADTVLSLDLQTFALTPVTTAGPGELLALDRAGGVWRRAAGATTLIGDAGKLTLTGQGSRWPFPALVPGELLLANGDRLCRGETVIAGLAAPRRVAPANEVVFYAAELLAVDGSGNVRVYDDDLGWLWRIVPGGEARVVAELPRDYPDRDGQPVGITPLVLRATSDGASWILDDADDMPRLLRVAPDGTITTAWQPGEDEDTRLHDFHVADDGRVTRLVEWSDDEGDGYRLDTPTGSLPLDLPEARRLAPAPDGAWYVASDNGLYLCKAGGKPVLVTDTYKWRDKQASDGSYLVSDTRGRVYGSNGSVIWRLTPPATVPEDLIGEDGKLFKGRSVDDGIGYELLSPGFDAAGNLFFLDPDHRQVKRVPAADLF